MKKVFVKSILAGMMIAIGSITYMNAPSVLGAFMFSIGLISIFQCNLYLFTGLVPYMNTRKEIPFISTVFMGNLIGGCLMFLFPSDMAVTTILSKLNESHLHTFISAILCNVLIFIAVQANKKKDLITVILSVAAFILCGFNHSIANICFVISARMFNRHTAALVLISLLGNALGGIWFRKLIEYADSKDRKELRS